MLQFGGLFFELDRLLFQLGRLVLELSVEDLERVAHSPGFGDITTDLRGAHDRAAAVENRRDTQRNLHARPVLADALLFVHEVGWEELEHGLADHFLRGIAEDARRALVPGDDRAVEAFANDRVVGGVDDRRQPTLGFNRFHGAEAIARSTPL